MFASNRTSQKGFSLVELMVVVAIIGVLASISVPQVGKFIAKARQSEAKSNLAGYYTAQKAFQGEYQIFDGRFGAIGFAPEGKLRYNVGAAAAGSIANATHGFTTAAPNASPNSNAYCTTTGVIGTGVAATGCTMLRGATGAVAPAVAGVVAAATFTAQAASRISEKGNADDVWSMNNNKEFIHVTNGIP